MSTVAQAETKAAQRTYFVYLFFNVISFNFIGLNIIILYSLRLGADSFLVGLLSSFYQVTFLFTPIGRRIVPRVGAVRTFAAFWLIRYVIMIPVILTVLPALRENQLLVYGILIVAVLGFNVAKGIGFAAHRPIVGELSSDRDRGAFLSSNQLIVHTMSIATGIAMAMLLGKGSSLSMYAVFLGTGTLAGFLASYFFSRLPEPEQAGKGFAAPLGDSLRVAVREPAFRRLSIYSFGSFFLISMAFSFLIVYFKRLYGHTDSSIVLFTVSGGVGAVAMALFSGLLLDRIGSKPLYFLFQAIITASLLPVFIAPQIDSQVLRFLFPVLVYFFFQMGHFGIMNSTDTYFFSVTEPEQRLNLGIVFNLTRGVSGFLGSLLGGSILTVLERAFSATAPPTFRLYFGMVVAVGLLLCVLVLRLPDAGSYPVPDALGIMFSPRDLKALRLLRHLHASSTEDEERQAVKALAETGSAVPVRDFIEKLRSPTLFVRMQALQALEPHGDDPRLTRLLIDEVETRQFTTAHMAAAMLGDRGSRESIPALRRAMRSSDYMLAGKAMVALAELGDRASASPIQGVVTTTENPRLLIYGAKALATMGAREALPVILRRLEDASYPFLRDELLLVCGELLGMGDWFYSLYATFIHDADAGLLQLRDELSRIQRKEGRQACSRVVDSLQQGEEAFSRAVAAIDWCVHGSHAAALAGPVLPPHASPRLAALEKFRFLVAAACIWCSRPDSSAEMQA